ncbi:transglycosylase domain-containing protein [Coprococcus sp. AF21-14LB]|uniref:transglycosylase domain-containing protein n=1 Tax=Coprococcus sp. AF21-14LB TaxID=2292231 RepID=UPI000E4CDC51|nr:transglycosylase domain-containing protein [Coprococcus sp. AF21-14LB]RGS76645.1 glycosyl transferase [Coprococcus sp. AF21-14LB]
MNYGKRNVSKKQKALTSKSTMKKKRAGVRVLKATLLTLILCAILAVVGVGLFAKRIIDNAPDISPANVKPEGYSTTVYNQDGSEELERFVAANANRIYKPISEIPKDLQHAFVAIEDERFYEHKGIDPQGIIRAGITGILNGGNFSQGASTLTQQLIKNTIYTDFMEEDTFYERVERKLQEQYLALQLEKQESKEQILENYLNTINLGQNTLGVQTAAKRYFGKDVSELSLSECAVVAAITQNPTRYNPITNPDENAKRRDKVLRNMAEQGYITEAQRQEALADQVYERIQIVNSAVSADDSPYTYFIDALSSQVQEDLETKLGYSATQAYNAVYSGGLSIFATQDKALQAICDEEINNDEYYPASEVGLSYAFTIVRADGTVENFGQEHIAAYMKEVHGDKYGLVFDSEETARAYVEEWKATVVRPDDQSHDEAFSTSPQPQASFLIMDQYTGQVKALSGGRGEKTSSKSFNRATDSARQPGSCFKILAAYAPAIDSCGYNLATTIKDEEYYYSDGEHKKVNNWWGDYYKGDMTVRSCIEQSANVCAVKTIADVTPALSMEYLKEFGLTTIVTDPNVQPNDVHEATALGGITNGVTNIEMTAAYAAIANGGVYNRPVLYTKVIDHDGNVLLDNTTPESHTVLKDSTAALLTDGMKSVIYGSSGTGRRAALYSGMPVSGKTGTTSSNVDIWFSGYTPYYTASIWAGYDSNKPLTNTSFHLTIWRSIMERIHESLPVREFALPDSVEKASVCSITGLRATSSCPTTSELFAKGDLPDDYCSGHVVETPDDDDDDKEDDNDSDSSSGTTQPESPTEPETPTTPETPTEPTPPPTQPETPTDPNTQNPPAQ